MAQQPSYEALKAQGSSLVNRGSEGTQAVQAEQLLGELNNQWTTLLDAWQQRMDLLDQCMNYLVGFVYNDIVHRVYTFMCVRTCIAISTRSEATGYCTE